MADEDDLQQYMEQSHAEEFEEEEEEDDLDDFLSDKPAKPVESAADRDARIKKELEQRKKAQEEMEKERERKKKEHEDWLNSLDPAERERYFMDQERKQRAMEEAARQQEIDKERARQEEMRRKAGAQETTKTEEGKGKNDRIENRWAYVGDRLVAEAVERKGPKKATREIQLKVPTGRVGAIIGKGGVNIKIITGKSHAKVQIHPPKPGEEEKGESLVTIKGSNEQIDKACETINQIFDQFGARRK
mmetsp:Transcript_9088/g.30287  ORF Transcript_9088/g.30287 Transcript_9088/m.30287 type:complete len:247 (-) Transcript_9088:32-772(-)